MALGVRTHSGQHGVDVVGGEEAGDPAARQERVDVDQEAFVHNLAVGDEEHHGRVLDTGQVDEAAQALLEILDTERR
eukprot:3543906-Prorocentrum_lima.AAC.1